jgi:hypothetical protein
MDPSDVDLVLVQDPVLIFQLLLQLAILIGAVSGRAYHFGSVDYVFWLFQNPSKRDFICADNVSIIFLILGREIDLQNFPEL